MRVQARREVEALRSRLTGEAPLSCEEAQATVAGLPERLAARLEESLGGSLERVLNATGISTPTSAGRRSGGRPGARDCRPRRAGGVRGRWAQPAVAS